MCVRGVRSRGSRFKNKTKKRKKSKKRKRKQSRDRHEKKKIPVGNCRLRRVQKWEDMPSMFSEVGEF